MVEIFRGEASVKVDSISPDLRLHQSHAGSRRHPRQICGVAGASRQDSQRRQWTYSRRHSRAAYQPRCAAQGGCVNVKNEPKYIILAHDQKGMQTCTFAKSHKILHYYSSSVH